MIDILTTILITWLAYRWIFAEVDAKHYRNLVEKSKVNRANP